MTPERAKFHLCLLENGDRTQLDAEVNAALEADGPLSDLILALSVSTGDEEMHHALHEYLLDHPADMHAVENMLRSELSSRFRQGRVTQEECLAMMRATGWDTDLAYDAVCVQEYMELANDGHISEEAAAMCMDALLRGEPLPDVWQLDGAIRRAKRRGEPYPGEAHPAVLALDNPGKTATIGKNTLSCRSQKSMFKKLKKRFIGDKAFYRNVLTLLIPLVIQQGVTSFVSLLDNLMVGTLQTESFSAVAIVNQIMMVFNLAVFGGLSGASIFGTQFFGKGDVDGLRQTFRFKMYFGMVVTVIGVGVLWGFDDALIGLFLRGESDGGDLVLALHEGLDYLHVMLWGLLPFVMTQTYVNSMRETGETFSPMVASIIAILTNLVLNFLLIFPTREMSLLGVSFTMPGAGMGVRGAAFATVVSRYVEMLYIIIAAHRDQHKYGFLRGAYRNGYVPLQLIMKIAVTGSPLLLNEIFWSLGMTFINQFYSSRGLNAVAATNITSTAWNLFCIIMFAMGNAVSIMVGQRLGAGDKQGARDVDNKLLFLTVVLHIIMGALLIAASGFITTLYNIDDAVRQTTRQMLIVAGLALPIHAFLHSTYFTIRSGGKTMITFLFDSVYTWMVPVVLAWYLSSHTDLSIVWIYFAVQFIDVLKLVIGLFMLRSDFWANNVVADVNTKQA